MKKIYVGTKTGLNFLRNEMEASSLMLDDCNRQVKAAFFDDRPLNQRPGVLHVLAEAVLPKFAIGYLGITRQRCYYSDSMLTVLNNIFAQTGTASSTARYISSLTNKQYTRYIARQQGYYFGKAIFNEIMQAGDCILLACLAEDDTCFTSGINFEPLKDWQLIYDDQVKSAVEQYLHSEKPIATSAIDFEDDVVEEETEEEKEVESDPISMFGGLSPSTQQLIMTYAKKRAGLERLGNRELALLACMQKAGDHSIEDLIKLYFSA